MVDTTLVSPLRGDGSPRPNAAVRAGVALQVARRRKERTHPELVGLRARGRVVVWAGEVGGRWSGGTLTYLRLWAEAKSRSEPPLLRRRAEMAWRLRWTHMLSCAAARIFAGSLLERRLNGGGDGEVPQVSDVVLEYRHARTWSDLRLRSGKVNGTRCACF